MGVGKSLKQDTKQLKERVAKALSKEAAFFANEDPTLVERKNIKF